MDHRDGRGNLHPDEVSEIINEADFSGNAVDVGTRIHQRIEQIRKDRAALHRELLAHADEHQAAAKGHVREAEQALKVLAELGLSAPSKTPVEKTVPRTLFLFRRRGMTDFMRLVCFVAAGCALVGLGLVLGN